MVDGLAWPLYGIPLLSFFLGFVVLAPRPWARWSLTLTGLVGAGLVGVVAAGQPDLVAGAGPVHRRRLPDPVDPGREPVVPARGRIG